MECNMTISCYTVCTVYMYCTLYISVPVTCTILWRDTLHLRLWDTGCMNTRCCAHTGWICIVSSWRGPALQYYIFLAWFRSSQARFHSNLGNKVISDTFSRDWWELFTISATVSKMLHFKHARLRFWRYDQDAFLIFSTTRTIIQKALVSPSAVFVWWVY